VGKGGAASSLVLRWALLAAEGSAAPGGALDVGNRAGPKRCSCACWPGGILQVPYPSLLAAAGSLKYQASRFLLQAGPLPFVPALSSALVWWELGELWVSVTASGGRGCCRGSSDREQVWE